MPRLIFKNNFEVALAQPTTTSDTTITIRSGSGFPTLGANERVVATIVDAATGLQFEIVTVTAVVGDVLTVQRAQEGTAARAWAAGDMLSIRTTAASLTNTVRNFGIVPSGMNLNALTGTWFGQYFQNSNGGASSALNYPAQQAGILEVLQTGVITESCIQRYTTFDSNNTYQRRFTMETQSWSSWVMIYSESSVIPVANGGTGQTTIQGVKDAFGFGPVADQSIVPTSMGGTGSADNAQAWLNIRPQGATPLAGDPVNDYDAATKRWVENLVNTGTVGPSMNGVMNYGVGDFHLRDSRAYIQPYEVVADGQLLNRADWPELWAYAQMLTPIADADWLADPLKRGKYSLGNGTTTFRVPDRNGVQTGSVRALFARGDGGSSSNDGVIMESFLPNINASISFHGSGPSATPSSGTNLAGSTGALQTTGDVIPRYVNGTSLLSTAANSFGGLTFSASRSSPAYGRNNLGTDEVLPRNFTGVWVIRASGGFVAANTQWQVINADAVRPGSGVKASSGQVRAQYKIGAVVEADAGLRCDAYMDGFYYAILSVYNKTKGVTKDLAFDDAGTLSSDRFAARYGSLMSWSETGTRIGTYATVRQSIGQNYAFNSLFSGGQQVDTGYATTLHHGLIHNNNGSFAQGTWLVVGDDNAQYQTRMNIQPNSHDVFFSVSILGSDSFYTLQKNAISDENLKHDIQPGTVEKAWSNLSSLEYVTFIYNNDEKERVRRGVIAQKAEIIDPLYVKTVKFYPSEGVEVEQKQLDTTPMLLDTMHVVQELMKKVESLEAEIAAIKAEK